jgi:Tfp pilus assembly protein FimT
MRLFSFFANQNQTLKKKISGVTLIELLVVIVLLGLTIILVGPFTLKQIESSKARNEYLSLQRWLQKQSFYAFTSQSNITIKFDGKALYSVVQPLSSQQELRLLSDEVNNVPNADVKDKLVNVNLAAQRKDYFNNLDDYLQSGNTQVDLSNIFTPTHTFSFIFFEPQIIKINNHGYFDSDILTYRLRGVSSELNMLDLIEGVSNGS